MEFSLKHWSNFQEKEILSCTLDSIRIPDLTQIALVWAFNFVSFSYCSSILDPSRDFILTIDSVL